MTEATAPPRARFELSMSARVAMAVAAALTIPLALPSALALAETAEQVGYVVGALSITVAGPPLVGWISFRRNPGADVTRVVVIAALVLVAVGVLPALAALEANVARTGDGYPASGPRAALHEAQREFDAARIGGDDQASMRAAGKAIDAFGAIADGDGRESMVWFGQRVRAVQAQHESFSRSLEAFLAGVDQPAEFDTAAEIDARRSCCDLLARVGVARGRGAAERVDEALAGDGPPHVGDVNGDGRGYIITSDPSSPAVSMHLSI